MIRDILLQLSSYPVPPRDWVFGAAASLADRHGAWVSAALCQPPIPKISNYLADKLVGANQAIAHENRQSLENARTLARAFADQVPETIRGDQILIDCAYFVSGARVAEQARVFDLVILPVHDYGRSVRPLPHAGVRSRRRHPQPDRGTAGAGPAVALKLRKGESDDCSPNDPAGLGPDRPLRPADRQGLPAW